MRCTRIASRLLAATGTFGMLSVAGGSISAGTIPYPPLYDMSCFTIGAVVECVDSGFIMPPMMVPGADDEGTNETLIIEDNGGYHEVRG